MPEFEVGDRVRIREEEDWAGGWFKGRVGTVIGQSGGVPAVLADEPHHELHDGHSKGGCPRHPNRVWFFHEHDLEKIEAAPAGPAPFKVGDMVKTPGHGYARIETMRYQVEHGNGVRRIFDADELSPVVD